ncbi:MAG: UTRA domain-containing protein [Sphingomonadaceae bacterium]|nr:UTRA domain-containing protein [Sphingomonadaceae bacterium]
MTAAEFRSWQSVQEEVLRRINSREWKPGELIPNEAELSVEFGCARATVNRALRGLAEAGLLDRRRKAGTRVALHPVRKATLDIPIIRHEVENRGQAYRYSLLSRTLKEPPADIRAKMQLPVGPRLLHVEGLHLANGNPHIFEDRWINPQVVREAEKADFSHISPNEWLVHNVPFHGGDIAFTAVDATPREAEILGCRGGQALFIIERNTWNDQGVITTVRLACAPGYRLHTGL